MNIQDLLHSIREAVAIFEQAIEDLARAVKECSGIFSSDTAEEPLHTQPLYKKKHHKRYKIISENIAVIQDNITKRVRGPPRAAPKLISSYNGSIIIN